MSKKYFSQNTNPNSALADDEPIFCKVLLLGDFGVGKTSLIQSYVDGVFPLNYKITIGVDFALKTINWCNRKVNIQFWDVAGSERNCGFLTRVYYRYASAAIIVADISRKNTFESATKWIQDLTNKLDLNVPKLLLVNKCDLVEYEIDKRYLNRYCKENNLAGWYTVSAKTRQNIEESVSFLISEILSGANPSLKNSSECIKASSKTIVMPNESIKITELNIDKDTYETTTQFYTSNTSANNTIKLDEPKNKSDELNGKCC